MNLSTLPPGIRAIQCPKQISLSFIRLGSVTGSCGNSLLVLAGQNVLTFFLITEAFEVGNSEFALGFT